MSIQPSILATLATKDAIGDLTILLSTVQLWSLEATKGSLEATKGSPAAPPTVYVFGDDAVCEYLRTSPFAPYVRTNNTLAPYTRYTRKEMEILPGKRSFSLWQDFMMEKITLLEWVFQSDPAGAVSNGVLFCDADICFLGPLPQIPSSVSVALSPHAIRKSDEARFGQYNGGFLWLREPAYLEVWREACASSRYFEQAALEDVAAAALASQGSNALYEFPITQNYGWWRLFQGEQPAKVVKQAWTMHTEKAPWSAGILITGSPLGSIHTHWYETRDAATVTYNTWVYDWLRRLAPIHPPAKALLDILPPSSKRIGSDWTR